MAPSKHMQIYVGVAANVRDSTARASPIVRRTCNIVPDVAIVPAAGAALGATCTQPVRTHALY